jgi:hypothetical protein
MGWKTKAYIQEVKEFRKEKRKRKYKPPLSQISHITG